jgi:hypothetical protein
MPSWTYFDLDGTIVPSDLHQTSFYFIMALPNNVQKIFKIILWILCLPLLGIIDLCLGEYWAIPFITWISIRGVSVQDAKIAAEKGIIPRLTRICRPQMLKEIKKRIESTEMDNIGKIDGQVFSPKQNQNISNENKVIIITGSLNVWVEDFSRTLGCDCLSTIAEINKEKQTYTGRIIGKAMVREEKGNSLKSKHNEKELKLFVSGFGNSENDFHFLKLVGKPFAVTPTSKLKKLAIYNEWSKEFFETDESNYYKERGYVGLWT